MKNLLIGLTLLASLSALAKNDAPEVVDYNYEESCSSIEYVVNEMNNALPENRQLKMECEDTFDSSLWGTIKTNYRSNITLTSQIPLCQNAKRSYREVLYPVNTVNIGISTLKMDQVYLILKDHSIDVTFKARGTTVGTMYAISSIQFPYCE